MKDYVTRKVGKGHYVKDNPDLGIRTEYIWQDGNLHVRYLQRADRVNDLNHLQRSNFTKYNHDGLQHVARIPMVTWNDLMQKTGHKAGVGLDEKKLKSILNDGDYAALKTVPGRI